MIVVMVQSIRPVARTLSALAVAGILACAPFFTACSANDEQEADPGPDMAEAHDTDGVELLIAEVLERYDFNDSSFTQGLEVAPDGTLYVATGWEGDSRIYRTTLEGEEEANAELEAQYFGEGMTRVGEYVWQLTWKNGTAFKRDAETLEEVDRASFDGEGWGLCHLEHAGELIFSDGSAQLRRLDPETFTERERFPVTLRGQPVDGLNELECVGDDIYANIFTTTDIVRIDATTGTVEAIIDASTLPNNAAPDPNNVLNGIAYLPDTPGRTGGTQEFLLTGKRWPDMYRVMFIPREKTDG